VEAGKGVTVMQTDKTVKGKILKMRKPKRQWVLLAPAVPKELLAKMEKLALVDKKGHLDLLGMMVRQEKMARKATRALVQRYLLSTLLLGVVLQVALLYLWPKILMLMGQ
jgi:hypothetical protein